jgi:hypothetical protein
MDLYATIVFVDAALKHDASGFGRKCPPFVSGETDKKRRYKLNVRQLPAISIGVSLEFVEQGGGSISELWEPTRVFACMRIPLKFE